MLEVQAYLLLRRRLRLAGSVKACYGHTEGTAGIHGALLSIMSINSRAAAPIMQLRSVNPYVSAALSDWRKDSRVEPIIPRVSTTAAGPLPATAVHDANLALHVTVHLRGTI